MGQLDQTSAGNGQDVHVIHDVHAYQIPVGEAAVKRVLLEPQGAQGHEGWNETHGWAGPIQVLQMAAWVYSRYYAPE
jgi:hypothetical protein